jgi:multiple RNA-binding domain-containing protein 1
MHKDEPSGPRISTRSVPNKKPGGEGQILVSSHVTFSGNDSDEDYQDLSNLRNVSESKDVNPVESFLNGSRLELPTEDRLNIHENTEGQNGNLNGVTCQNNKGAVAVADESMPTNANSRTMNQTDEERCISLAQETGRLYITNLSYAVTESELVKLLDPFGTISSIHIPIHRDSKQAKGIAFVQYVVHSDAVKALLSLRSQFFQGRVLCIQAAHCEAQKSESAASSKAGFKGKKLAQLKSKAGSDFNWNSLYLAADGVAGAMANKLGVTKSDILDREADNAAVRLAVAETHLVQETKNYFASMGVVLDAFKQNLRSETVILAKNISSDCSEIEIFDLFQKYGQIGRLVFPPSGMIAIVEYLASNDAKSAFRHLSYKKFGSLPLYLEWAPRNCFEVPFNPLSHSRQAESNKASLEVVGENPTAGLSSLALMEAKSDRLIKGGENQKNTKLIVRNIPFEATVKDLKQLFSTFAHVKNIRLPKKVTGGHRGFGFAEFLTHDEALEAAKNLRHTHLYGRRLVFEFANVAESLSEVREKTRHIHMQSSMKRQKVDLEGKYTERANEEELDEE